MNIIYTPRFFQLYPQDPVPEPQCRVNQEYQTLPNTWPRKREIDGPASVAKRLYPSEPNCYPYMYRDVPVGTMYANDLGAVTMIQAQTDTGENLGTYPKRSYYQYKAYPLQNISSRELRHYRAEVLPRPDIRNWVSYPVAVPGQTFGDWGV